MEWPGFLATVFPTPYHFLAACGALALAEAVYVLLGFGAGLIAVGTLALVLPNLQDVVVIVLLVNLPAEVFVVWTARHEIAFRGLLLMIAAIAVGIPIGGWLLTFGPASVLLVVLGATLVGVGLTFLILPDRDRSKGCRSLGPGFGVTSGILTGLFGTGGPPLILYYRLQGLTKGAFRGHLMALFLVMTAIRLPSYFGLGLLTGPRLAAGAAVLPAVIAGGVVGHLIHVDLSERQFFTGVSVGLIGIGCLLLLG